MRASGRLRCCVCDLTVNNLHTSQTQIGSDPYRTSRPIDSVGSATRRPAVVASEMLFCCPLQAPTENANVIDARKQMVSCHRGQIRQTRHA
eukprot:3177885-Rhodomonas_salina.2